MDRREPCPKLTTRQRNPDLNRSNECDNAQSAPASAVFPGFRESPDHFCFSGFSTRSPAFSSGALRKNHLRQPLGGRDFDLLAAPFPP